MELVALTTCHILRGDTVTQSHREQKTRSFSESGLQNYTHAWDVVCAKPIGQFFHQTTPLFQEGDPLLITSSAWLIA